MDPLAIVFLLLFVAAAGAAVWLLMQRSGALANMARAEAETSAARASAESATAELAGLREQLAAAVERASEAGAVSAELTGRAEVTADAHRAAIEAIRSQHRAEIESLAAKHAAGVAAVEQLSAERLASVEKARLQIEAHVQSAEEKFADVFKSLASATLEGNTKQFLELANQKLNAVTSEAVGAIDGKKVAIDQVIAPLTKLLDDTRKTIGTLETNRTSSQSELKTLIESLGQSNRDLKGETARLVNALRRPEVRGRYGELQLQKVAELSGMSPYCDFALQSSVRDGEGNILRPDMIVKLPNGREIAIDAKANIDAYLQAHEGEKTPDEQDECMERFARHMSDQVGALGKKAYWRNYAGSPDFVVMFIPSDLFLDAALSRRRDLLETAAGQGVILATPSSLIALLRVVAVGFREEKLAANAAELYRLVAELHSRFVTAIEHVSAVGTNLERAIGKYNDFAGSYNRMLLPQLRAVEEAGAKSEKQLSDMKTVMAKALVVAPPKALPSLAQPASDPSNG